MVRSTQRAYRAISGRTIVPQTHLIRGRATSHRRHFHDYFVTHLPSSSLHPDSRSSAGPRHQLPRSASKPHTPRSSTEPSPAPVQGLSRDTTVVRIPLRSAKHHFGVSVSRGQRPYNEDTYQAGVIELPAFAKRVPVSLTRAPASSPLQAYREKQARAREEAAKTAGENNGGVTSAEGSYGDPQVFYFGVYDGHGGSECSEFLKERLHTYIEESARDFGLGSTLSLPASPAKTETARQEPANTLKPPSVDELPSGEKQDFYRRSELKSAKPPTPGKEDSASPVGNDPPVEQPVNTKRALELEKSLITGWKELVGGYFRRFKPALFSESEDATTDISTVLTYAFLRADYDFVRAQARKADGDADPLLGDAPLNADDVLENPSMPMQIGGPKRFKGGSTCSIALISTPTPTPFWNPATTATIVVAHVGDSRILLCRTSDGQAEPVTTNHHPNNPAEGRRLRRYAGNIVTDSFGEERMGGLANTRAFGDMQSKRMGVSAEPQISRIEMAPAQYSFLVLISDGVSGTLSDQEVADIVKEAKTPEQGAKDVVAFATEVSGEGDNTTCICIRLGGWERRSEGGLGSLGTRESRDYRRQDAADPRRRAH
jgi:protein phosphatase PTC6